MKAQSEDEILVSICCITYNHARFIRDTLDGFLGQKTDFKFEVLIHDDASTDGTEEIIREYEANYPNIIKPLYETENQYSKGVSMSKTFNFPRVKGKYMAMCDGDDYWIDENKLQKQVDFMEANPDYTICFHKVLRKFDKHIQGDDVLPSEEIKTKITNFDFKNLLICNFMQTSSLLFRWDAVKDVAREFPSGIIPGDWYLNLMFAKNGKIKFINEIMSVYRVNEGGVWFNNYIDIRKLWRQNGFKLTKFYLNVHKNITKNSPAYFLKRVYPNYMRIGKFFLENKEFYKFISYKLKFFKIYFMYFEVIIKTFLKKRKLLIFINS